MILMRGYSYFCWRVGWNERKIMRWEVVDNHRSIMRWLTKVADSLSYPDNEREGLRVRKERRVGGVRFPRKGEQARQQRRLVG